jgi:hypothetical protein
LTKKLHHAIAFHRYKSRCGSAGAAMKARQLIGGSAYPPEVLRILFDVFDDAWAAVAPSVGTDQADVDMARLSLADMVLRLAKAGPIERDVLKHAPVNCFRYKRRSYWSVGE